MILESTQTKILYVAQQTGDPAKNWSDIAVKLKDCLLAKFPLNERRLIFCFSQAFN